MAQKFIRTGAVLLSVLALTQCGGNTPAIEGEIQETEPIDVLTVSGPKSGVYGIVRLAAEMLEGRPSAAMGVFTSTFISQGMFLSVESAIAGIEAQLQFLKGQSTVTSDETFALLQEFGSILQINIEDLLNRSDDRAKTLDQYTQNLINISILAERKAKEISANIERYEEERSVQRKETRDIERSAKDALNEGNYGEAGAREQELSAAKARLSETETNLKSAKRTLDQYEELLKIAQERINAIMKNRDVLIAGLKVIDVPGIEALDILEKGERTRRGSRTGTQNNNPVPTESGLDTQHQEGYFGPIPHFIQED